MQLLHFDPVHLFAIKPHNFPWIGIPQAHIRHGKKGGLARASINLVRRCPKRFELSISETGYPRNQVSREAVVKGGSAAASGIASQRENCLIGG